MGKGLRRKQEDQFTYLQNERLKEAVDDLLARIPPEQQQRIEAVSKSSDVREGDTVVARSDDQGARVEFLRGDVVCGVLDAALIAELQLPSLAAGLFRVASNKDGILCLVVGSVDRKRLRPKTQGDEGDDD